MNEQNLKPFPKGKSGNPAGRPVGSQNRNTIARKILNLIVNVPEKQLNKFREFWPDIADKVTGEELITYAAQYRALKNDSSYKVIMDSAYGAPKQELDMVGEIKITDHKLSIEVVKPPKDEE